MGFYWSYTLLLKPPALMRSCYYDVVLSQDHLFLPILRCIYSCALHFTFRADALSETANRVDHVLYAGGKHVLIKFVTTTPVYVLA